MIHNDRKIPQQPTVFLKPLKVDLIWGTFKDMQIIIILFFQPWLSPSTASDSQNSTPQPPSPSPQPNCDQSNVSAESDPSEVSKAIEQRHFRLQELLESEKTYVQDLEQCVEYIKFMRVSKDAEEPEVIMPEDLREGKDRMVFGNIEAIFEWHRDFFIKNLEKSIANPVELGNLFKKYDRKFQMYVVYCQNKPKSEFIVSEYIDSYFEV